VPLEQPFLRRSQIGNARLGIIGKAARLGNTAVAAIAAGGLNGFLTVTKFQNIN